jgi:hypothetical protein
MRRRLPAVVVALLVGACTFPDVAYDAGEMPIEASPVETSVPDDAPTTSESGMTSEAGDVASGRDGTTDGPAQETSTFDAPPPDDVYVFEAAADAPACDQDQDMALALGGACGGQDCDDEDPRAHPGQGYLTALPRATTMYGDWNCNHVIEKQFPTNVNCGASITNCDATSGFMDDPACGTAGMFVQCMTMNVIFCVVGSSSMQLQGCK